MMFLLSLHLNTSIVLDRFLSQEDSSKRILESKQKEINQFLKKEGWSNSMTAIVIYATWIKACDIKSLLFDTILNRLLFILFTCFQRKHFVLCIQTCFLFKAPVRFLDCSHGQGQDLSASSIIFYDHTTI
jgi:hypothetical protein